MSKYAECAIKAVEFYPYELCPEKAWYKAAAIVFPHSISQREKRCPRFSFLGLCEEGLVKGIPSGHYTDSEKNKLYAIKAVELLKENPGLSLNKSRLWNLISYKKHNNQMDVVVALWEKGLIV